MDPKRKKIYIGIIAVCVLLSVGILMWSKSSSPVVVPPAVTAPTTGANRSAAPATVNGETVYSAPAVFPANNKLDASVLDSTAFKTLQSAARLELKAGELGRDDIFKNY